MQMRTIEIVVGTFMLAGLVSLAILAIQISGFNIGTDTNTYSVIARFENIGGLDVRSRVSIAGVDVGTVAEITLDQDTFMAVVTMEIDASVNQISTDTIAVILTEGLIGGKLVGLTIGADEDYLQDGDEIMDTQSAIVLEELIGQFLLKKF